MSEQLDLDAIRTRAAGFVENPLMRDARVLQLAGVDVPALLAEVERLRADAVAALRATGWVDPEEAARLRGELGHWTSGRRRKGMPVVESVPDGLQYAVALVREQHADNLAEAQSDLLRDAGIRLRDLSDVASRLLAERDALLPVVEAARAWRDWHGTERCVARDGRWVDVLSKEERALAAAVDALDQKAPETAPETALRVREHGYREAITELRDEFDRMLNPSTPLTYRQAWLAAITHLESRSRGTPTTPKPESAALVTAVDAPDQKGPTR